MKKPVMNQKYLVLVLGLVVFGTQGVSYGQISYDVDEDGLIEVSNLGQLNAIRWDLDGDGVSSSTDYAVAFPDASPGMGCPASGCIGYELTTDLDFDSNGNGEPDEGDWNGGAAWAPIEWEEGFSATFDGNGHTISNLRSGVGLFAVTLPGSVINRIGLVSAFVAGSGYGVRGTLVGVNYGAINNSYSSGVIGGCFDAIGGLVGANVGTITNSYTTGDVFSASITGGGTLSDAFEDWTGGIWIGSSRTCYSEGGGLVGLNQGTITASYSASIVSGFHHTFGGLVGSNYGTIAGSYATGNVSGNGYTSVGGLAGKNGITYAGGKHVPGSIIASYATGNVSGRGDSFGGLVGSNSGTIIASYSTGRSRGYNRFDGYKGGGLVDWNRPKGVVVNSYWDVQTSGRTSSDGGIGKTTQELQSPTDYTGIYSEWNVDVDGDGSKDDPWDFGTSSQYPALKSGPPQLIASVSETLTETTLDGIAVTLMLRAGAYEYEQSVSDIRNAVTVSGITGVTFDVERVGDKEVRVDLAFDGNIDSDDTLIVTVRADAIANYDGLALTVEIPFIYSYDWNPAFDFNTLQDAGIPYGLWSDGTTMWVGNWEGKEIYAYNLSTKARDPAKDFNTLQAAGNDHFLGLWSDGTTMWVGDWEDGKIYAYNLSTKARDPAKDFNTLQAAGNDHFLGLWSDGTTMWVGDWEDGKLYAYNLSTKARDPAKDFNTLQDAGNYIPTGLWSDGTTMWVGDWEDGKLYAYNLSTKARDPAKDFNTLQDAGNHIPTVLWSDGTIMWVGDWVGKKIYAYSMPTNGGTPDADVPGTPTIRDAQDFNTLQAAGNTVPAGLWSDGTTLWVVDGFNKKLYAYNLSTKARDPAKDFNTLRSAGNTVPTGLWSDGTTLWVADLLDKKLYAYNLSTKARDPAKDFNTLQAAGNDKPQGLWSDGTTLWVVEDNSHDAKLYAYNLSTKARDPAKDFNTLQAAGNDKPQGLWSDGTTLWVADLLDEKLYAYNLSTKAHDPAKDFNTLQAAGNYKPRGLWSDGTTLWVADLLDGKIYAYNLPARAKPVAMTREMIGLPEETQLQQNAPNPFNSETVISWSLREPGPVRLEVFSVIGQRVVVLLQGPQQAGYHRLHWDGRDAAGLPLASGIYLYRLVTAEGILTRKLTLLR